MPKRTRLSSIISHRRSLAPATEKISYSLLPLPPFDAKPPQSTPLPKSGVQCQIFSKFHHTALEWGQRFNHSYTAHDLPPTFASGCWRGSSMLRRACTLTTVIGQGSLMHWLSFSLVSVTAWLLPHPPPCEAVDSPSCQSVKAIWGLVGASNIRESLQVTDFLWGSRVTPYCSSFWAFLLTFLQLNLSLASTHLSDVRKRKSIQSISLLRPLSMKRKAKCTKQDACFTFCKGGHDPIKEGSPPHSVMLVSQLLAVSSSTTTEEIQNGWDAWITPLTSLQPLPPHSRWSAPSHSKRSGTWVARLPYYFPHLSTYILAFEAHWLALLGFCTSHWRSNDSTKPELALMNIRSTAQFRRFLHLAFRGGMKVLSSVPGGWILRITKKWREVNQSVSYVIYTGTSAKAFR